MIIGIVYDKYINSLLKTLLKPFSKLLPERFKFPINGTFTVKGENVKPFKIHTNPTSYLSRKLFWDGIRGFEYNSVRVFCEVVKSANVFFDIGSNIGYYSLLASSIKNGDITIYAFEPMPSAYTFLNKNAVINGFSNIKPQQLALSDSTGTATFYSIQNAKFARFAQLAGDSGLSLNQSGSRTKVSFDVQTDTLDNFAEGMPKKNKIDLIKLDTEANEHRVLSGAHIVLNNHRPIIQCEILKNQIEHEVETIMNKYNYLYFRATDIGLVPVKTFLGNQSAFVDYYLVPKEKRALIEDFIVPINEQHNI